MNGVVEVTQRPVSADDEEFLFQLYAGTRAEEMAGWGWPADQQEMFLRMQYRARTQSYAVAHAGADQIVFVVNGALIGAAIVCRSPAEIHLVDIAFLPECRGHGIGANWLAGLIRDAEAAGLPLRLSVHCGNKAIHLYQRLGFQVTQSDPMYLQMEYKRGGTE